MKHFRKRQASLVNELGWTKGRANYVWHGESPYRRDVVNEIAAWLGIQPFELLMRPQDALSLRRLRDTARAIAAEEGAEFEGAPLIESNSEKAKAEMPRQRGKS